MTSEDQITEALDALGGAVARLRQEKGEYRVRVLELQAALTNLVNAKSTPDQAWIDAEVAETNRVLGNSQPGNSPQPKKQ